MNVNLMTLPCPRCKKAIPIEARKCACGHRFVKEPVVVEQRSFPPIQVLLPELERVFKPLPKPEREIPVPPIVETPVSLAPANVKLPEKSDRVSHVRPPVFHCLSILAESEPEPRSRLRFFIPIAAIAAIAAFFAAWGGYFGQIDGAFGGQFFAAPVAETLDETTDKSAAPPATDAVPVQPEPVASADREEHLASESNTLVPVTTQRETSRKDARDTRRSASPRGLLPVAMENPLDRSAAKTGRSSDAKPRTSANGAVPAALCGDGTYSYSRSSGDPCAQRGGVAERFAPGHPVTEGTPPEVRTYVLGPRGGCYYLSSSGKKVYVKKELCG